MMLADVDLNHLLDGPLVPVVTMLAAFSTVLTIWIIASQWRRVRVAEAEAGLKLRMVERGYSADEIDRVLQATPGGGQPYRRRRFVPCRPPTRKEFFNGT